MQETVKKVLTGDFNRKKALMFLITALATILVWYPSTALESRVSLLYNNV